MPSGGRNAVHCESFKKCTHFGWPGRCCRSCRERLVTGRRERERTARASRKLNFWFWKPQRIYSNVCVSTSAMSEQTKEVYFTFEFGFCFRQLCRTADRARFYSIQKRPSSLFARVCVCVWLSQICFRRQTQRADESDKWKHWNGFPFVLHLNFVDRMWFWLFVHFAIVSILIYFQNGISATNTLEHKHTGGEMVWGAESAQRKCVVSIKIYGFADVRARKFN